MNGFIPLSVPNLNGNEMKYVSEAIKSEWVSTGGPFVTRFESEIGDYIGASAVACQSGTAGIHLSLLSAGVGIGDEVLAPTLTFIAAINPIKYVGAQPVFLDCDDSLCIDPEKLESFCKNNCDIKDGKLINKASQAHIKALIVVHIFGNMADMESIMEICAKYHLIVIEDATEAIGTYYTHGRYNGGHAGTLGRTGVYSFNGNKLITTGGGGMIIGNDEDALKKIRYLSTQAKDDELNFIHNEIGYNYRMTNLQAAVGIAQLEQIEKFIHTKKQNYDIYKNVLDGVKKIKLLPFRDGTRPNYWFYSIVLEDGYPMDKTGMIRHLGEHNIQARPVWGLIHEQKPYRSNQIYMIEKAEYYQRRIVNPPCSTNLNEDDARAIARLIADRA